MLRDLLWSLEELVSEKRLHDKIMENTVIILNIIQKKRVN